MLYMLLDAILWGIHTPNIYDFILDEAKQTDVIKETCVSNLDIIPSNVDLAGLEVDLLTDEKREYFLKDRLQPLLGKYDYILIDCPPSLGLLTINALAAADAVLIPLQCEYFALEGLGKLLNTIRIIQNRLNTDLEIEGILLTMYDVRVRLSNQVVEEVRKHFSNLVFDTIVPRNIKLSEAPSFGIPALIHDADSKGAISYLNLANEIGHKNALIK